MSAPTRTLPLLGEPASDIPDPPVGPESPRAAASRAEARRFMQASAPRTPAFHLLEGVSGVLVADGSRLFDVEAASLEAWRAARDGGDAEGMLTRLGLTGTPLIDDTPVQDPPLHAISLAIAQKCNLGCTYCYAQQGEFGGPARNMSREVARRSVELLVNGVAPGSRVNIAFLGGEPLANREVLREATRHAAQLGDARGVHVGFSITTNGTLVTPDDGDFFEAHAFAVTVSLDGPREVHDRQRPARGGQGTFDRIMRNVAPLLERQRRMQVAARVTVTPIHLELVETLDAFIAAGFHSVGFSPMLRSPTGTGEMRREDLEVMLGEMIACGREYERHALRGERYPFANMANAMKEIAKGTHRPYPCGAGAGYVGISAEGELSACHRFVGDEDGAMGSLTEGLDRARQAQWLASRHVHRQSPCTACWARYLCGGGCHHEVIARGRPACDYIRGWLHYCLEAFLRLSPPAPPTA